MSRDKLEFLTSPFDEGKQSGLQTLKNIIMAMLTGTDSRQIILRYIVIFRGSRIWRHLSIISTRFSVKCRIYLSVTRFFEFFTNIVNEMAQRKELPPSSNIPSAPSTLDKLTDFIGKNINHEANSVAG